MTVMKEMKARTAIFRSWPPWTNPLRSNPDRPESGRLI
jgi:hypothetical protein